MALGVNIVSEFDSKGINKAIKDFQRLKTGADKTAFALQTTTSAVNNGIKNFAKFGAAAGLVSGVIGKKLIDAGSNLEESMSKINVVFGDSAQSVKDFASTAAQSMGISNQQALEAAGTYGNLLQAFGTTREAASQMSIKMVQLAGDLASFNNVPVEEALLAIRSGLSGEAEPLKRFGIAINDVRLKQEALALKLYDGKGPLSVLAKSQAAYALILKDSSLAQGDYSRTSDGVANMQRTLIATFQDISAELGTALLPAFKTILGFLNTSVIPVFRKFSDIVGTEGLGAAFKYLGEQGLEALGKLNGWGDLVFGVVTAVVALNFATGIYTALQTLATIAMTAFGTAATGTAIAMNAAFFGIPALIGAVVVIIAALALRFKGFREVLGKMIPILRYVINFFLDAFVNPFVKGINYLIKAYNGLPFLDDIPLLTELEIGSNKAKKSVESLGDELRKLKPTLKLTAGAILPKKKTKKTGGGDDDTDTTAMDKAKTALEKYTSALKLFGSETKAFNDATKGIATATLSLANATDDVRVAQDKFNKVSKGYGAGSKEAATATRDLADAQRSAVRATLSLRDATRNVADAQKELNDLKSGKVVNQAEAELATATQKVADAQNAVALARKSMRTSSITKAEKELEDALDSQKDAQDKVTEARKLATPEAIQTAEEKLTTAILDQEDAKIALADANQDVLDKQKELNEVINGAATDSDIYKDALKDLTDAQKTERDATDEVTEAYKKQAEALLELNNARKGLSQAAKGTTKKQEEEAQRLTGIDPNTGQFVGAGITTGGGGNGFSGGMMVLPSIDFSNMDFSNIDFSGFDFASIFPNGFPMMAEGGIVNNPTLAMIGESGSEAVVPLDRLNSGGDIYNITINSKIADSTLPDFLVAELRKFNRRSGAIDIQVT
jgi:hypothetical protein